MQGRRTLICGAGIAGPACAFWLRRHGFSVVLVEKAQSLRDGGQNVDVKGAAQKVVALMGLDQRIEALNTRECGQKWLDEHGRLVAILPKGGFGSLTSDFEILRGDLARVFFDATRNECEYRFGTYVTSFDEVNCGIVANFNKGRSEIFDLAICAEGVNSRTRDREFSEETNHRRLGAFMAFFSVPKLATDDYWACSVNGRGGTFITVRPGNETHTTVLVTFPAKPSDPDTLAPAAAKAILRAALEGRGTMAERISGELDRVGDVYFGQMMQIQASAWSHGRLVLLGDAAHCPTAFTGKGTALSLVAAYVLAGEIKRNTSHVDAFRAYERLVRPYAERAQREINPALIRLLHMKSRPAIGVARMVQRAVASSLIQALCSPKATTKARHVERDFPIPNY